MDKAENDRGVCPTCGLTMSMFHPDHAADYGAVLRCPMDASLDTPAATVGEYLGLLLSTLWTQGDGFSGKRPFGNSSWEYDVYLSLAAAGLITGLVVDEDGYVATFERADQDRADELILQTIKYMTHIDGDD